MIPPITSLQDLLRFLFRMPIPQVTPRLAGDAVPKAPAPHESRSEYLSPEECAELEWRVTQLLWRYERMRGASAAFALVTTYNSGVHIVDAHSNSSDSVPGEIPIDVLVPAAPMLGLLAYWPSIYGEINTLISRHDQLCEPGSGRPLVLIKGGKPSSKKPTAHFEGIPPWPLRSPFPTVRGDVILRDFTPELVAVLAAVGGVAMAGLRTAAVGLGSWYWKVAWGL